MNIFLVLMFWQSTINPNGPSATSSDPSYYLVVLCACILLLNIGMIISLEKSRMMTREIREMLKKPH